MADARPTLWTSDDIARASGGALEGPPFAASGVAIDSREIEHGDLFVALAAARDGHDFVHAALAAGAAGSLASRGVAGSSVQVSDTFDGLRGMAAFSRDRALLARRGAVTGSVGKTSVTQAVLAGLLRAGDGHGSTRSFNNHIGVPLTLARMPAASRAAVFEIGMNHAGEIAPLTRLVRPHAVAITNVEAVHVENFPDGEAGVARAKAEIFQGVEPGGVAILNADNRWFEFHAAEATARGLEVRSFGRSDGAAARLERLRRLDGGLEVVAQLDGAPIAFRLRHHGEHWGPTSLCALLMMETLGVPRETALTSLAELEPLAGRGAELRITTPGGQIRLIDESYNASPVSVRAALATLRDREPSGRRIAVLTDMLELGPDSPALHAALARDVQAAGVDLLFCAGPLMRDLYDAVDPTRRGGYAQSAEALAADLVSALGPGDVVMVKGSKASKASLIVDALLAASSAARDP